MNKQNKIIVGVVALILALTIGYAVFSQSLNIKGTAKAEGSFGLIFEKSAKEPTCSGYSGGDDCSIDDVATISGDKKTLNIIVNSLLYPTAYVKIPVLIKNTGTIDAVLESMEITGLESNDIDVKYSITDKDIENGYIVKPGDDNRKEVEVEVSWNKDSTHNSSEPISIDFSITMNYKQATNVVVTTSSSSNSKCTTFTKKDTYEVGDVIAFCNNNTGKSEDFYVIKDNGDTVTALAKYNLMVGNKVIYDDGFENVLSNTALTSSDKDYGLQSELTKIEVTEEGTPTSTTLYGTISFADKNESNKTDDGKYLGYWTNKENKELNKPLEKYGQSYPANVYDELVALGCDPDEGTCTKEFMYKDFFYWSSSARGYNDMWFVHPSGGVAFYNIYRGSATIGVRPVITINKSEI